jgi:hypothetical protein
VDRNEYTDQLVGLKPRIRFRALGEEGVMINMESGRVIVLNEVGLKIVQALEKPKTRCQLVEIVTKEYEVAERQAEIDLEKFLANMTVEQVLSFPSQE